MGNHNHHHNNTTMSLFPRARTLFPELRQAFRMLEEAPFASFDSPVRGTLDSLSARPSIDVHETQEGFEVEAEVPGIKKEDLNLNFSNDGQTLTLSGHFAQQARSNSAASAQTTPVEQQATSEATEATTQATDVVNTTGSQPPAPMSLWSERSFGSFSRSLRFPYPVDSSAAKANLTDGLLKLTVPRKTNGEVHKIEIE